MLPNDFFNRLTQQLSEGLKHVSQAPEEIHKTVHGVVKSTFTRLDLVSRQDFESLLEILTRTRERVEILEKKLASLEAQINVSTVTDAETHNQSTNKF